MTDSFALFGIQNNNDGWVIISYVSGKKIFFSKVYITNLSFCILERYNKKVYPEATVNLCSSCKDRFDEQKIESAMILATKQDADLIIRDMQFYTLDPKL
jgi:hypothetical protein